MATSEFEEDKIQCDGCQTMIVRDQFCWLLKKGYNWRGNFERRRHGPNVVICNDCAGEILDD